MPTHWGVTRAIRDRDSRAADRAMRALINHTAGDLDRALHRSDNGHEGEAG